MGYWIPNDVVKHEVRDTKRVTDKNQNKVMWVKQVRIQVKYWKSARKEEFQDTVPLV